MEINGVYNLGPDLNNTNGSPYWLQKDGKLAIWKSPDNNWIFGNKENIGSSSWNGISSSGKSTGPYDAAKWTYTTSRWHFAFDLDLNIEFDMGNCVRIYRLRDGLGYILRCIRIYSHNQVVLRYTARCIRIYS